MGISSEEKSEDMEASTVGGYDEWTKSDFTDMKNLGSRETGAIPAAVMLKKIVRDISEPISISGYRLGG